MLTEQQARAAGYELVRGSYYGTTDDRADRWYIDLDFVTTVDRRGSGYRTKREALDALAQLLGDEPANYE
jgi:hypothetical protein